MDRSLSLWTEFASQLDSTQSHWRYAGMHAAYAAIALELPDECERIALAVRGATPKSDPGMLIEVDAMLARLAIQDGRLEVAERSLEQAEERLSTMPPESVADSIAFNVRKRRIELALASDRTQEVIRLASTWLESGDLSPMDEAAVWLDLASAEFDEEVETPGILRASRTSLEGARAALTQMEQPDGASSLWARLELQQARVELDDGELDTAEDFLGRAGDWIPGAEEAGARSFDHRVLATLTAELALARGLTGSALDSASSRLSASLAQTEKEAAARALPDDGLGPLHFRNVRASLATWARLEVARLGEKEGVDSALGWWVRFQALGALSRRCASPVPSITQLGSTFLEGQRGLLWFMFDEKSSVLLVIDESDRRLVEVPGLDVSQSLRNNYLASLLTVPPEAGSVRELILEEERTRARELSRRLIPRVAEEALIRWKGASLVGLDILGPLPVAYLPVGTDRLGEHLPFEVVPSVPLAVQRGLNSSRGQADRSIDCLIVGGVTPSVELSRSQPEVTALPLTDRMLKDLSGGFQSVISLRGSSATKSNLAQFWPDSRLLQFVVHGVPAESPATGVALVLQPDLEGDGQLDRTEVVQLGRDSLAPEMVLLTACRSATGPMRRGGEGSTDLAGAFLEAGSSAVVVSDSDLSLGAAMEWSRDFHQALLGGSLTAANAAHVAYRKAFARHGEDAPFRAGLLKVVGLGQQPRAPFDRAKSSRLPILATVAGSALALVLLARRSRQTRSRRIASTAS